MGGVEWGREGRESLGEFGGWMSLGVGGAKEGEGGEEGMGCDVSAD